MAAVTSVYMGKTGATVDRLGLYEQQWKDALNQQDAATQMKVFDFTDLENIETCQLFSLYDQFPPYEQDLDGDGLIVGVEEIINKPAGREGDPYYASLDTNIDSDLDGLLDAFEALHFSDNSGELGHGFKLNDSTWQDGLTQAGQADPDGDGLNNLMEQALETNPLANDTDGDGIDDFYEVSHLLDPTFAGDATEDFDDDGLNNLQEYLAKTNMFVPDTDKDGLLDGEDDNPLLINDLDNDGIADLLDEDRDGDNIPDEIELLLGQSIDSKNQLKNEATAFRTVNLGFNNLYVTELQTKSVEVATSRVSGSFDSEYVLATPLQLTVNNVIAASTLDTSSTEVIDALAELGLQADQLATFDAVAAEANFYLLLDQTQVAISGVGIESSTGLEKLADDADKFKYKVIQQDNFILLQFSIRDGSAYDLDAVPDNGKVVVNVTLLTNDQGVSNSVRLEDAFPSNPNIFLDVDQDGVPDLVESTCDESCQQNGSIQLDAFPNNSAASVDEDQDGFPDTWNVGCNDACQINSGLTLDLFLNDPVNVDVYPPNITIVSDSLYTVFDQTSHPEIAAFVSSITAEDDIDGVVPVTNNLPNALVLGANPVSFSATDSAGNVSSVNATIFVVSIPTVTSATYNAATGQVDVTGSDFITEPGVDNDINSSAFTFIGKNLGEYTLQSSPNVDISSASSFIINLSEEDKSAVDLLLDKNGTESSDSVLYNLAVTDDFVNAVRSGDSDDLTGNGILVSRVAPIISIPDSEVSVNSSDFTIIGSHTSDGMQISIYNDLNLDGLKDSNDALLQTTVVNGEWQFNLTLLVNATNQYVVLADVGGSDESATIMVPTIIHDSVAPNLTIPNTLNLSSTSRSGLSSSNAQITDFLQAASATDLITKEVAVTNDAPNRFPIGTTLVTFLAVDEAGNSATNTATVNIDFVDVIPPVISLIGGDVTLIEGENYIDVGATASDNEDGDISARIVVTGAVDANTLGTYTLTYNVSDAAGNAAIPVIRTIMVSEVPDTKAPIVTAPKAITVNTENTDGVDSSNNIIAAFLAAATAEDDRDTELIVSVQGELPVYPEGETIITFTATDSAGNTGSASSTITVVIDSDSEAPSFSTIEPIVQEAAGELTSIVLQNPAVTDNYPDTVTITVDNEGPFKLGDTVITWTAVDGSGNSAQATQTITVVDSSAPEIVAADILVNARGLLTDISNEIDATAFDIVDGEVDVAIKGSRQLTSGSHTVELLAKDSNGNEAKHSVIVSIIPYAVIGVDKLASNGSKVSLVVSLSGEALAYPVTVNYSVSGVAISNGDSVQIDSGSSSTISVDIDERAITGESAFVTLLSATNANVGSRDTASINIIESNQRPTIETEVKQNGSAVSIIDATQGDIVISAVVVDINAADTHDVIFSSEQLGDLGSGSEVLIPIEALTPGRYSVSVTAAENNTVDLFSVRKDISFTIPESNIELSAEQDTDGDGISDAEEGVTDSDGDGIADFMDDDDDTSRLPAAENSAPIQTIPGLRLSLGEVSQIVGQGLSSNAALTLEEFASVTGNQAVLNTEFEPVGDLVNFIVSGMQIPGEIVPIIIPLPNGITIPEGAVYRKFTDANGWLNFEDNANNSIHSAALNEDGNCPSPQSADYQNGLIAGGHCIQLLIADGGIYDNDGEANGVIEDPGMLAILTPNNPPEVYLAKVAINTNEQTAVTLDASASIDEDGDELTYSWSQVSGPEVELIDSESAISSFMAPDVTTDSNIVIKLTISDGYNDVTAEIIVTVVDVPEVAIVTPEPESQESSAGSVLWMLILLIIFYCRRHFVLSEVKSYWQRQDRKGTF